MRFSLARTALRYVLVGIAASLAASNASAQEAYCSDCDCPCESNMPRCMFFAGAGAGLGLVGSGEQSVYNLGISQIYDSGVLVATGSADGPPVTTRLGTEADCVPFAQVGYFRHIGNGDWLWGVKQSYSYIGANLSENNLNIPQYGTSSNPNVSTFEGFSITRSYEVFTDHQFALTPFLGRSFKNGFVYGGAGASLSHAGASLNDVVGFATINGDLLDISGRPQSVQDTQWAFGVAATAGVTYFLTPKVFLDLSYTFSNPFLNDFHVEQPFHNEAYAPLVFEGTLIGDYSANLCTHLITASLNFGF